MATHLYLVGLILFWTTLLAQSDDPHRLSHKVEPLYQLIQLNLDPDEDVYTGSTSIELKIKESIDFFRLHGQEFEIFKADLEQKGVSFPINIDFQQYGFLKVIPEKNIPAGDYILKIQFGGHFDKKGLGIVKYTKDSLNYLYTQMEPIHARKFFPCFDEPIFKFEYQLEITAPKDYLVVSNTPDQTDSIHENSKTTLFKKTKPMPSYLLAFAVGPYETTPIPGISFPARIILPKGYTDKSQFIKGHTAKILTSLENYFGSLYPYEKLDFIGPGYPGGAMENPGLVVYREDYLIDSDQRSKTERQYLLHTTAHELAHMWFGNLVSLKWWDDNWLKEGLAEWLAREIVYQEFPEFIMENYISEIENYPMNDDIKATTEPIHRHLRGNEDPDEVFGSLTYYKSPAVLRMVENWIGKEIFRQAMQAYIKTYRWGNADAEDLFRILQETSGKDIIQVMHDFVFQAGVPIITGTLKNRNTLVLSQERYKSLENLNTYSTLWHIPVSLKIYDGNAVEQRYVFLDQKTKEFSFPEFETIDWVHLKSNLQGYYIQSISKDRFERAIFSYHLDLNEKGDLFTGLRYSYLAGGTNPTDFLQTAFDLRKTSDVAIIESTVDRVTDVNNDFVDVVDKDNLHFYYDQTLMPMLEPLGYDFHEGEPESKSNAVCKKSVGLVPPAR